MINLLAASGDYALTVVDRDAARLATLASANVSPVAVDCSDAAALARVLPGHDVVVSASPFYLTPVIATAGKPTASAVKQIVSFMSCPPLARAVVIATRMISGR